MPDINDVKAIVAGLLDAQTVTYQARLAGDTFAAGVAFAARRQPLTSGDDGSGLAKRWCRFQLYASAGQVVKPARMGQITDGGGTVYQVEAVQVRFSQLVFDCDCIQNVP